jgi:type VI protein secretion system component Hcp
VSISSPASGASVSGTITVSATASDNVGVAGVQFKLDGVNLGAEDTSAPYSVTWDTTSFPNGSHGLTALARDTANNSGTSSTDGVTVSNDLTPPVLSAVASSGITSSAATITWTTNEAADSQVEYGTTTAYGSSTVLNPALVTSHSQALSGLVSSTTYHYRVESRDKAGNLATSADFTFTTLAAVQSSYLGSPFAVPALIQAEDFDLGGEGVAYHDNVPGNAGGAYRPAEDVDIVRTGSIHRVNNFETGEWLEYSISVALGGTYKIELQAASAMDGSRFHIEIDGVSQTGSIVVPNTGGWTVFQSVGQAISLSAGPHVLRIQSDQQYLDLDSVRITNDLAPPVLSGVASSGITSSAATITWTTNEAADSQVEYGATTAYGSSTALNPALVASHSQTLSGLVSSTTYHYRVKSRDAAGNLATSADFTFTTLVAVQSSYSGSPFAVPGLIQAEDFDLGGEGVAYHDNVPGNAGGAYRPTEDVDILQAGGIHRVNNFETGEWLEYTITVALAGTYEIELQASSATAASRFHIEVDGVAQTGSIAVPNTGGWTVFQSIGQGGISLSAGQHVLRIQSDQQYFDLDSIQISSDP